MSHPYEKFETTVIWSIIKKALNELRENQDINITTKDENIIGFLCKALIDNKETSWLNDIQ